MLSEGGISWVPMAMERLTRSYRQREASPGTWPDDVDPVDIVRRNFRFASIEDPAAWRLLDIIGEHTVMIETDYPHMDSTWPSTQSMFRREPSHLPDDTVRRICYENAADLYRHPASPEVMLESPGRNFPWRDRAENDLPKFVGGSRLSPTPVAENAGSLRRCRSRQPDGRRWWKIRGRPGTCWYTD